MGKATDRLHTWYHFAFKDDNLNLYHLLFYSTNTNSKFPFCDATFMNNATYGPRTWLEAQVYRFCETMCLRLSYKYNSITLSLIEQWTKCYWAAIILSFRRKFMFINIMIIAWGPQVRPDNTALNWNEEHLTLQSDIGYTSRHPSV